MSLVWSIFSNQIDQTKNINEDNELPIADPDLQQKILSCAIEDNDLI